MNNSGHGESMSSIDRAWLEMDQPRNPMVVNAIVELSGPGGANALARTLGERLLRCPRFRQRADTDRHPPAWVEEDSRPDLRYHLRIHRLGAAASDADLRRAVGEELRFPLDRQRPLWRCTLFVRRRGHITVLFRAHHAMADGIALMKLLLANADSAAGAADVPQPSGAEPHEGPLGPLIDRLEAANEMLGKAGRIISEDLHHPETFLQQLRDAGDAMAALGRVLQLPEDNPPILRRPLSGHRHVAWSSCLRLAPLRALARKQGVSLNDVFVAALAGALSQWLSERGAALSAEQNLRVSIPVNLRPAQDGSLGNQFGLVLLDLPVGAVEWQERLRICSERMRALKASGEARAVLIGLSAAGHLPVTLERRLVQLIAGKSVAVVSNLPGPQRALRIGGMRITNLVFWPPQAGDIGLGVSLLSYAGQVTVGVSADSGVVADPGRIVEAFEAQLSGMLQRPLRNRGTEPRPQHAAA